MPLEQVNLVLTKAAPRDGNRRGHDTEEVTSMHGKPTGNLCACGCGRETRRYGSRVCRYVDKHYVTHNVKGKHAGYRVEDWGYSTPCWIWQGGTQGDGYGRMSIGGRNVPAHRAYYEEIHGSIEPGLQIDHLCFVPACVNPAHLEPVTCAENIRRGRRTILNVEKVREIKRTLAAAMYANGGRVPNGLYEELAQQYGTVKGTIRAIRKGASWRDV